MKQSVALSLILALFAAVPVVSHAQSSGGMKGMDMNLDAPMSPQQ